MERKRFNLPVMPINKETTTVVKVAMPKETKEALEAVAARKDVSLSLLLLSAAVNTYLLTGKHKSKTSEEEDKTPVSATNGKQSEEVPPKEPINLDSYRRLHINMLWQRFEEGKEHDKMMKSRLSIIGSYDRLFKLSDKKHSDYVRKVEFFTKDHDPEDLPWFPLDRTRQFWAQMDGNEFKRYLIRLGV